MKSKVYQVNFTSQKTGRVFGLVVQATGKREAKAIAEQKVGVYKGEKVEVWGVR